jgi:hypothetical protein
VVGEQIRDIRVCVAFDVFNVVRGDERRGQQGRLVFVFPTGFASCPRVVLICTRNPLKGL